MTITTILLLIVVLSIYVMFGSGASKIQLSIITIFGTVTITGLILASSFVTFLIFGVGILIPVLVVKKG